MDANKIDDHQTTQDEAHSMLVNLCEEGFDRNIGELAAAIGRDFDETEDLLNGVEDFDEDLVMKIRGIAEERGIEIE